MSTGSKKKNLVIFTIYYPPVISIASYRLEAFAKYLNKDKFTITVICPNLTNDSLFQDLDNVDVIRVKHQPHSLKIKFRKNDSFIIHKFKALYNYIFNYFVTDEYKKWRENAINAFKELHSSQKVDYVISTFPTVAPHLAALKLRNEGFDFKWIVDMRDEMSLNPFNNFVLKKYLHKIERKLFAKANLITTTTPSFVSNFKKLSNGRIKVEEIRNGFDFEITNDYNYNEVFTITHTGTFYSDIKPYTFLQAISSLLFEKNLPEMKIVFIGAGNTVSIPGELNKIVSCTPKIPHDEAVQRIKESDTNLLVVPNSMSKAIQGKLYEYIASQKPVIALADESSEGAKLINACNAGFIAAMNDVEQIKLAILKAHGLWETQQRLKINIDYFKQFHRKEQVNKLEKLILSDSMD
jgi:hypothetical protein